MNLSDMIERDAAFMQLARFKVPRDLVFIDTLPRNALGKVQRFRLTEMVATA